MRLFGLLFLCGGVAVYFFNQPLVHVAVICIGLFILLQLFNMAVTFMLAAEAINKYLPHLSNIEGKLNGLGNQIYRLQESLEVNKYRLSEINTNLQQLEAINTKLQAIINKQTSPK